MKTPQRNLSGIYFRCKVSGGKWGNATFEDLTDDEQDEQLKGRSEEWLKSMIKSLAHTLRKMGDQFDIVSE